MSTAINENELKELRDLSQRVVELSRAAGATDAEVLTLSLIHI